MKHKPDNNITSQYPHSFASPPMVLEQTGKHPITFAHPVEPRRRRNRWEKILLGLELIILVAILLVIGGITENRLAIRQTLSTDGVTIISQQVLAASPANAVPSLNDGSNLPLGTLSTAPQPSEPTEIPEHLRGLIFPNGPKTNIVINKPKSEPGTRIVIPSINVDAPIGEGTDWESLKYKVGHHPGTANPGERGNMVLAAHNDVFGEIFRYLPDVPVGEIITVQTENQTLRYRITERRIILPTETEVMLPTTEPTITLISCYPYLIDTHRIILFGELIG